jgi:hypothetical protein
MQETAASPIHQRFVERSNPLASGVDFGVRNYKISQLVLELDGVPMKWTKSDEVALLSLFRKLVRRFNVIFSCVKQEEEEESGSGSEAESGSATGSTSEGESEGSDSESDSGSEADEDSHDPENDHEFDGNLLYVLYIILFYILFL